MIKSITKEDLLKCIDIFHKGYETVALEFGLRKSPIYDWIYGVQIINIENYSESIHRFYKL